MSVIRYHTRARRLDDELKSMFHRFVEDDTTGVVHQWTPRVDIREEAERFVILADLPGVDPASIEVQMDKGMLSIKGERATFAAEDRERYSRVERAHGAFFRRFALPDTADAEGITATGVHGVLEIAIPKRAQAQPRRIEVR